MLQSVHRDPRFADAFSFFSFIAPTFSFHTLQGAQQDTNAAAEHCNDAVPEEAKRKNNNRSTFAQQGFFSSTI